MRQLSTRPLGRIQNMNIIERHRNKKTVGLIANGISIAFLIDLIVQTFNMGGNKPEEYVVFAIIAINIVFLSISTRKIQQSVTQTKLGTIGKLLALFFSLVAIYLYINGKVKFESELLLAFVIAIYVPYSIYVFRKKNETIELPVQQEKYISSDAFKLPPDAWS